MIDWPYLPLIFIQYHECSLTRQQSGFRQVMTVPAIYLVDPSERNPACLGSVQHYWVSAQSEYSTDILFKTRQDLCELYQQLLSHSVLWRQGGHEFPWT